MRFLTVAVASLAAATVLLPGPGEAAAAKRAPRKICVAVVVDARSVGGHVSTDCAKVSKGTTGIQVLRAAGHKVLTKDGGAFVCAIDGVPASGCRGVSNDDYWAYWHRAPGAKNWTYSVVGAASYQPVNNSAEGWVYDHGKSLQPKNVAQQQICKTG